MPGLNVRIRRALSLVAGALALSFAGASRAERIPLVKLGPAQERGLGVTLAVVQAADARPVARVPAVFAPPPNGEAVVVAPFAGVVTRVLALEGQAVRPGQPLALMFSREGAAAAAELVQARNEEDVALRNRRRTDELVREGIVAGARAEEADARARTAAAMTRAKAVPVRAAGVDASGRFTVRAPIGGRIVHLAVTVGQALAAGETVFKVDRTDRIQAQGALAADLVGRVRPGDGVRIEGVEGRVVAVGAQVDPRTRSLSLVAEVPPRPAFVAGRGTVVEVFDPAAHGLLEAPRGALIHVGGRPAVFVHREGGYAATPVEVAGYTEGAVRFRGPVPVGAAVAVSAVSELKKLAER